MRIPLKNGISRRDFIRTGLIGATVLAVRPTAFAQTPSAEVWMIHGENKEKLMASCLQIIGENGGFGRNIKTLALKVNSAWPRTPEQGANTHPTLVSGFIQGAREHGVSNIVVPEHPCVRAEHSFTRSGILEAVKKSGAEMIDLGAHKEHFVDMKLPKGKSLTQAHVAKQFLQADAIVNMPVAKHHGGARLTMSMKNWMGAVKDRGYWHRNDLHQCIADFGTLIKPDWAIVDATRIMMSRGPQGPSRDMKTPNLLIVSKDQVAADAVASTLFVDDPKEIGYLKYAASRNIGTADLDQITIHKVEA